METLDRLIKNGNQPKRSFYVAFGHDEEVSGNQGAGKISTRIHQKCPREFTYFVHENSPFMSTRNLPPLKTKNTEHDFARFCRF